MIVALIVAAGQGTRMGSACRKQYLHLADRPILAHCLEAFTTHDLVDHIYLVVSREDVEQCRSRLLPGLKGGTQITLVEGGAERQESVYNGLCAIAVPDCIVLIHDGVRPFVPADLITACIEGARRWKACIPGLPATETLKQVGTDNIIRRTIERRAVRLAQTPQAFELRLIKKAHEEARRLGWQVTDDASILERCGDTVHVIEGRRENIKITVPEDLAWAEHWLRARGQG